MTRCGYPSTTRTPDTHELRERWMALAAGGSVPTPESRSEQPVVARKRPNGDRREARGESGRTVLRSGG